jgi:perosamine synthetase
MIPQVLPDFGLKEMWAVVKTIKNNWVTEGPKCKEFSEKLNELMGVKYGVFAPNGTLALYLGLLALGIGPGDEVIVPNTTFIASANAVILTGAKPIFVDVSKRGYQLDVSKIKLTENTKAIMPVHLYGSGCDMIEIMSFAEKNNLLVIEDAAQTIGVKYFNKHLGTFGDVGTFSFFADKTITTGEGAYVVCKDESVYNSLRMLRNQGRFNSGSFVHPGFGVNFRITDMQGALGCVQLDKLDSIIEKKKRIMKWYRKELLPAGGEFYKRNYDADYVPFRIVIFHKQAQELMRHLELNGVQARSFFYPLHWQPCFNYKYKDSDFENSIYGYKHGVCLPIYTSLKKWQVKFICEKIRGFHVS